MFFVNFEPYSFMEHKYCSDKFWQILSVCLMMVTAILALFFWEGHQGFSMQDEGFLWYGAQRVLMGEVPFRDFQSYDIGRYYWSAGWMLLSGNNGVVTLRVAAILFQILTCLIGLSVIIRNSSKQSLFFWLLMVITLTVWMFPSYRLFDLSLPIVLIAALSCLVEQPSRSRYFLAGLIVGLLAVFGRNHGVYAAVGSISVIIYLMIKRESGPGPVAAFSCWLVGVVTGFLPVLMFIAFVPGFAPVFWESFRALFEIKTTNFSLPVPWPWLVPFGKLSFLRMLHDVLKGIFFLGLIIFGALGILGIIRQRLNNKHVSSVLIASVSLALPYAHYAYSRADVEHLALGMPPFLLGIFGLLAKRSAGIKWTFAVLLCSATLFFALPEHPGWYCDGKQKCVAIKVDGDSLKVRSHTAHNLTALSMLAQKFAPGDRTFIAVPYYPGAYAALERKSPIWVIYASYPRSEAAQQAEIERIKAANPGFAVIDNFPLDGHKHLQFSTTHPLVEKYIRDHFERLNDLETNPAIYRSKQRKDNHESGL